jgi:hypothetical protein
MSATGNGGRHFLAVIPAQAGIQGCRKGSLTAEILNDMPGDLRRAAVRRWSRKGCQAAILPVERFIAYEHALGILPESAEAKPLGVLPQYYADMFGWREMTAAVGAAFQALPPEDRARAVFFAGNYGHDGSVLFRVGGTRDALLKSYGSVEAVGRIEQPYAMPYETGLTLWLCRDRKRTLDADWPELKHYD